MRGATKEGFETPAANRYPSLELRSRDRENTQGWGQPSYQAPSAGGRRRLLLIRHSAANLVVPLEPVYARRPPTASLVASAGVHAQPAMTALLFPPLGAPSCRPAALRGRARALMHFLGTTRSPMRKSWGYANKGPENPGLSDPLRSFSPNCYRHRSGQGLWPSHVLPEER